MLVISLCFALEFFAADLQLQALVFTMS